MFDMHCKTVKVFVVGYGACINSVIYVLSYRLPIQKPDKLCIYSQFYWVTYSCDWFINIWSVPRLTTVQYVVKLEYIKMVTIPEYISLTRGNYVNDSHVALAQFWPCRRIDATT